ncbi:MAG TPA: DUF411 domain-containing protein [Woeseiaceae bacterium]|nr:DUF411 domain-containing protein [Woeseiaceae bacterium]
MRPILSLTLIVAFIIGWGIIRDEPVNTAPEDADIIVYVSPRCSCHRPWISDLRRDGLVVGVVETRDIVKSQAELGVPREFAACHTAVADDYWIEGHVPAASIISLLNNPSTDAAGLAYLRAEIPSGDQLVWEVVTYDAEGDPIVTLTQVEQPTESDTGATHEQ